MPARVMQFDMELYGKKERPGDWHFLNLSSEGKRRSTHK